MPKGLRRARGRFAWVLGCSVALLLPLPATGQIAAPPPTRVRVIDVLGKRYTGRLLSTIDADPLEVLDAGRTLSVRRFDVVSVELGERRGRGTGFVRKGLVGAVAGAAGGALVTSIANRGNSEGVESVTTGEAALVGAFVFGFLGFVGGGVAGLVRPGYRWTSISLAAVPTARSIVGVVRIGLERPSLRRGGAR